MKRNPNVDAYIRKQKVWQCELQALRTIVRECPLTEEIKWRAPCYTFDGKNIVLLGSLKNCCTLSFPKGALLKDAEGILTKPGENTRAARLIRFTNVDDIDDLKSVLRVYIREAIELEKSGRKADFKADRTLDLPGELLDKFAANPKLEIAFEALTPGRQRGYVLHFSAARQSRTRASRIDSCEQKILAGKGFHDCTCGLSKRMPTCDGSHKSIQ